MKLTKRLERLEARINARSQDDGFYLCRRLIYDPCKWDIKKDDAISCMIADDLDQLVASGEIRESQRDRVEFIVREIVRPVPRFYVEGG